MPQSGGSRLSLRVESRRRHSRDHDRRGFERSAGPDPGQVSENVYDTATGRYILIPQGAKLVGTYDNSVTTGQERVLIAWTRIIYPDASSLDLGKMPGADEGGFAGFHDQVDDHFLKVFGNAILLSVVSAGVQLSQGNANNQTSGLTTQQTIAAALGQQLGQLGQERRAGTCRYSPRSKFVPAIASWSWSQRTSCCAPGSGAKRREDAEMAVGLGPENWASLALCGVFVGLVSSLLAIEPGFLLLPLLAILLPRLGVPTEATAPIAIATALALLVPVSIARLQPLPRAERRHVAWLSPAILAGAFFGASLVPLIPEPWLLAGFAVTAGSFFCAGRPTLP